MKFIGLLAVLLAPGMVVSYPRTGTALLLTAALVANIVYSGGAMSPADWQAINTVSEDEATDDYWMISKTLERAESSNAHVVVFPEGALPQWTESAESFFESRLSGLGARRQILLAGAVMSADSPNRMGEVNFAEQLQVLQASESSGEVLPGVHVGPVSEVAYRNGIVALGGASAVVQQRVPVPFGMWRPFTGTGVPLNVAGDGILEVAGQRAAVLICYEQLLVWPAVVSMLHRPTLIVGIANDHWVRHTPIPELQQMYLQSWSRLSDLPLISASNR
jgi:apolipoprotein N-acyltransferase